MVALDLLGYQIQVLAVDNYLSYQPLMVGYDKPYQL